MNYSFTRAVGDGVTRVFAFSFAGANNGYIDITRDIQAFVAGQPAAFTVTRLDPTKVTFNVAPPVGAEVLIRRVMPRNLPYSDFKRGNAFSMDTLNYSFLQQLYLVQELLDGFLPDGFYWKQDLNMGGHKVVNMAPGTAPGEAIEYNQLVEVDKHVDEVDEKHTAWNERQDSAINSLKEGLVENVSSRTIPWLHISVGGEDTIKPPFNFHSAWVWRQGVMQYQLAGAFEIVDNTVMLAEPLLPGEEVLIAMGSNAATPDGAPSYEDVLNMISNQTGYLKDDMGNYTSRITDFGVGFANWPQGKGAVVGDRAYFGFNLATGHGTIASDAMVCYTHNGIDFSKVRTIAKRTSTEAASAWSLGALADGSLVSIVRFRKGTSDTAPIRHSIYTSPNGISWTEIADIPFRAQEGNDIVAFHGYVLMSDGRFAVGYHDVPGNLGVLIVNPANWTYETKVLLTAAQNNSGGKVLQCELNFLRRQDTDRILIVSRSQNVGVAGCKAWTANGNFTQISQPADFPMPYSVNPVTPVFTPDFKSICFFYANRYDQANFKSTQSGLYMRKCPIEAAFALDFVKGSSVIRLATTSAGYSNAAGVGGCQHAVLCGDRIFLAFPSKVEDSDARSDVYCMTLEFNEANKKATTTPLASQRGSAASSFSELRLEGNSMYDARLRMDGISLMTLSDTNVEFGSYGSALDGRGVAFYSYDGTGVKSPAMYIRPNVGSYGGRFGQVDINRDMRLLKADSIMHWGTGFRLRVGGDTANVGQSLIYHNPATGGIEFGSTAANFPMKFWSYGPDGIEFARAGVGGAAFNLRLIDSSGLVSIISSGGSVGGLAFSTPDVLQAVRIARNGGMLSKREIKAGDFLVNELPTEAALGGMVYARNGRKGGEEAGKGTGIPVYWDGAVWRTFYDNSIVSA